MSKTTDWTDTFRKALEQAAAKAGFKAPRFEDCTTDATWGDRCGLVFWGEAPEVCERAARYFESWARKHLRAMNVIGGYNQQESIGVEGQFYFARYANGAKGWYRIRKDTKIPVEGTGQTYNVGGEPYTNTVEEVRLGYATSYVYYPCAD